MKVSIGSKIIDGPWGGGNLFVANLSNYLTQKGHKVIFNLSEPDIDLIILTDPRSRKESTSTFNHLEIERYKKYVNKNVLVVQRINECDERKGTDNINKFYLEVSKSANHVVFVSSWLMNIYLNLGIDSTKSSVILAGADKRIFNPSNLIELKRGEKLKIVTHHWSSHENKGFKIYKELDDLIGNIFWKNKIEFTYIGNMPEDINFLNTKVVPPLAGKNLADELKKNNIYITASINEPSGNHHIEAAQCGLPILYLNSGGIPEYCNGYGISFEDDFENKLCEMVDNFEIYKDKMLHYPRNSEKMCEEFYTLFNDLLSKKTNYKNSFNLHKPFIIIKHKFFEHFRDKFYFNFKNKIIQTIRSIIK